MNLIRVSNLELRFEWLFYCTLSCQRSFLFLSSNYCSNSSISFMCWWGPWDAVVTGVLLSWDYFVTHTIPKVKTEFLMFTSSLLFVSIFGQIQVKSQKSFKTEQVLSKQVSSQTSRPWGQVLAKSQVNCMFFQVFECWLELERVHYVFP